MNVTNLDEKKTCSTEVLYRVCRTSTKTVTETITPWILWPQIVQVCKFRNYNNEALTFTLRALHFSECLTIRINYFSLSECFLINVTKEFLILRKCRNKTLRRFLSRSLLCFKVSRTFKILNVKKFLESVEFRYYLANILTIYDNSSKKIVKHGMKCFLNFNFCCLFYFYCVT